MSSAASPPKTPPYSWAPCCIDCVVKYCQWCPGYRVNISRPVELGLLPPNWDRNSMAGAQQNAGGGEGKQETPPFLPKPGDEAGGVELKGMGPIGPWATGRVDWGPLGGLTGTRPIVDHYSVTRYSDAEWRKHNQEVLSSSAEGLHRVNMAEFNSRKGLECIAASADKNQQTNTERLATRTHELLRWKNEVERSLEAMMEELSLLEAQRRRAYQAKAALGLIRSISSECMGRRAMREGHDLARDKVEEELVKEAALIKEVNDLMDRTIQQINEQLVRNQSVKNRLETDWSDKQESFLLDANNVCLHNNSPTILFKPASARFTENQSSPGGWEKATRELLTLAEAVKGQSCELRALLDGPILSDCIRDLKSQADKVDIALARGISDNEQCVNAMYTELDVVVRRNGESEKLILDLQHCIRGLDKAMKVAQSRLDNRMQRPRCENSRDEAYMGLVEEVKSLGEQSTTMKGLLHEAENCLVELIKSRGILEKELQNKLKTLDIDKNRCQAMRALYPSASSMSGF